MQGSEIINELMSFLKLNPSQFSEKLGMKRPQGIYDIQNNKVAISRAMASKIVSKYPDISITWLLTGEGEMVKTTKPNESNLSGMQLVKREIEVIPGNKSYQEQRRDQKNSETWHGVPMFDAPISASFVESYRDENQYHPRFYLRDDRFRDCDFGSVIRGDSMHSEIRHGDFVVCKEVDDFGFVVFGEIYYVIATNGLETCKYLHPGENADEYLLKAYNKQVPPTPIPKSYLKKLYKVRGILRSY